MQQKTLVRDLTTGNPLKQLVTFAIPFVLANLLQQLYNLVDMVIVGQFVGSAGLTAASNGGEIATFFLFISIGVASAGQIMISQHIGKGNLERLGKCIGTLFTFGFLLSAAMTVISLIGCDWFLKLMNIPEEAQAYAHDYSLTYFCGMVPVFGYNLVSSMLRGMGDSKHPFLFIAIAAVLNTVLDLLFVGVFNMECFGAALATVISQTTSFIVAICFLMKHKEEFGFDFRLSSFRIDPQEFRPLLKMGIPVSLQGIAISGSMLYINSLINSLGLTASAASAVGNKLVLIATIVTNAMNAAGTSIVGQNFAAGKLKRVSQTLAGVLGISMAFCLLLAAAILLFPEQIFSLFDTDPRVLELSHVYAIYGAVSFLGFGTRAPSFSLLNGIGFASMNFICSIMDGIVARIGFSLLFGVALSMGIEGYWLGMAIAGNVIGVIVLFYYLSGKWKTRKLLIES